MGIISRRGTKKNVRDQQGIWMGRIHGDESL